MKAAWCDAVEVYDADGELEGYALVKRTTRYGQRSDGNYNPETEIESVRLGDSRILGKIHCCRTCAWSEAA